jgi:hypothetical protein
MLGSESTADSGVDSFQFHDARLLSPARMRDLDADIIAGRWME